MKDEQATSEKDEGSAGWKRWMERSRKQMRWRRGRSISQEEEEELIPTLPCCYLAASLWTGLFWAGLGALAGAGRPRATRLWVGWGEGGGEEEEEKEGVEGGEGGRGQVRKEEKQKRGTSEKQQRRKRNLKY